MYIYDYLYQINTKYKSVVHVWAMDQDGQMSRVLAVPPKDLVNELLKLDFSQNINYYISGNTYIYGRPRQTEYIYSLHNIVVDLDIHDKDVCQGVREELLRDLVWRLKRDLFDNADSETNLPEPNIVVYTGRGVQLWWHIEEASFRVMSLYKLVSKYILLIIRAYLEDYPELMQYNIIDDGASGNPNGLYRLVNTNNPKVGRQVEYEMLNDCEYDLNVLKGYLEENEVIVEYLHQEKQKQETKTEAFKECSQNKVSNSLQERKHRGRYASLYRKRLWIIERIIESMERHKDYRNSLLFVAYNTARLLYSKAEAQKYCEELNKRLNPPKRHLNYLFRQKIYYFGEVVILEYLPVSEEEYEKMSKEYYAAHRNDLRDEERRIRREEREKKKDNARMLLMAGSKSKDVAEETGLSVSTVQKLSAQIGKKKNEIKPWEAEGISRTTYYRRRQENGTKIA